MNPTVLKVLKVGGACLVGAILGGVAGYYIAEQVRLAREEREIEEQEKLIAKALINIDPNQDMLPGIENKPAEKETKEEEPVKKTKIKKEDLPKMDYSAIGNHKVFPPKPELEDLVRDYKADKQNLEASVQQTPPPVNKKYPYIISRDAFNDECESYSKISLVYYEDDTTLAYALNEDTTVEARGTVGLEALKNFGKDSGDKDVVFVRNDSVATDYEVSRIHNSYRNAVLQEGENDSPRLTVPRKKRKAKHDKSSEENSDD